MFISLIRTGSVFCCLQLYQVLSISLAHRRRSIHVCWKERREGGVGKEGRTGRQARKGEVGGQGFGPLLWARCAQASSETSG